MFTAREYKKITSSMYRSLIFLARQFRVKVLLYRCQSCEAQLEAFEACGQNSGREMSARLTATYHAAHNDYVLQLCAANAVHRHYHIAVLPATLKVSCFVCNHKLLSEADPEEAELAYAP